MFDNIIDVSPAKQTWKLKVRVIRLWKMFRMTEPDKPLALEMVLIDSTGCKIQATIRKPMLRKFYSSVKEGEVYGISFFGVVPNTGSFRATKHQYKILFHLKTVIHGCHDISIPMNMLNVSNAEEIDNTNGNSDYLIDAMGILTAVSEEKVSVKEGVTTRLIELQLVDEKGPIRCALFGGYVDSVNEFLQPGGHELPIVVLQFMKVKTYKGETVIQNVMQTSRLIWNPQTNDVVHFKNRMISHGFEIAVPLTVIQHTRRFIPLAEDFLQLYPRKSIMELHATEEEGIFVVLGVIKAIFDNDSWFYEACKCHKAVSLKSGTYHCSSCQTSVSDVVPRFRLRLEVIDDGESAVFTIFDSDCVNILGQTCASVVNGIKDPKCSKHPQILNKLIGLELLFKVEKDADYAFRYDDSFKVKKICNDSSIIKQFKTGNNISTPKKSKFPVTYGDANPDSDPYVSIESPFVNSVNLGEDSVVRVSREDLTSGVVDVPQNSKVGCSAVVDIPQSSNVGSSVVPESSLSCKKILNSVNLSDDDNFHVSCENFIPAVVDKSESNNGGSSGVRASNISCKKMLDFKKMKVEK